MGDCFFFLNSESACYSVQQPEFESPSVHVLEGIQYANMASPQRTLLWHEISDSTFHKDLL